MKVTVQLPDDLLDALRSRSVAEGRSLDATVEETLRRGLDHDPEIGKVADLLGDWVVQRPTARFDPEAFDRALDQFGDRLRGLDEALDWTREERDL